MNQPDLFTDAQVHPRARKSDPLTSHLAAAEGEKSGRFKAQAKQVLEAVKAFPGRTSRELAREAKMDRYVFARRLPELETDGEVRKGEPRECWVGKRQAVTWWGL